MAESLFLYEVVVVFTILYLYLQNRERVYIIYIIIIILLHPQNNWITMPIIIKKKKIG